jgi:hypothetical protein
MIGFDDDPCSVHTHAGPSCPFVGLTYVPPSSVTVSPGWIVEDLSAAESDQGFDLDPFPPDEPERLT